MGGGKAGSRSEDGSNVGFRNRGEGIPEYVEATEHSTGQYGRAEEVERTDAAST